MSRFEDYGGSNSFHSYLANYGSNLGKIGKKTKKYRGYFDHPRFPASSACAVSPSGDNTPSPDSLIKTIRAIHAAESLNSIHSSRVSVRSSAENFIPSEECLQAVIAEKIDVS